MSYETHASSVSVDAKFCNISHENNSIEYTDLCFNSAHLFGCAGLKRQEYCILNRKYAPTEYYELKNRIIAHMLETGEYGEFFPPSLSPFGYNETVAQDYYPLSKAEALECGFNWSDFELPIPETARELPADDLPESAQTTPESITECGIRCSSSSRLFRITKPELALYQRLSLPLPRQHPDVRYAERISLRNSRHPRSAQCGDCDRALQTHVPPGRFASVLCEDCYLKRIF